MPQGKKVVETFGEEGEPLAQKSNEDANVNVTGPVAAWVMLLFAALAVKIVVNSGVLSGSVSSISSILSTISNLILGAPGEVILPLIVGAAIGAEVGARSNSLAKAEKGGLLNGVYVSVVYLVGILIIYEVLADLLPSATPTINILVTTWILLPIAICIALTEVFAILSFSRKSNS